MPSQQKLTQHILIALLFGALCGLIINTNSVENDWIDRFITDGLLLVMGKWFIAFLMLLVVPLVFVSLVKGIASLTDIAKLGKISIWTVTLKDMATFAFSTSSSAATIPVTLATTQRLGVGTQVSGFTIPLGATINMDGTAIMQGVATVFIANAYGIALLPADFAMIIITATLASIGTAAVPGAGLIMLTMVLTQFGLPIEGIALILGVDRLLDMMRTTVNVTGDVVVSVIVADKTDQLDREQYHKKNHKGSALFKASYRMIKQQEQNCGFERVKEKRFFYSMFRWQS